MFIFNVNVVHRNCGPLRQGLIANQGVHGADVALHDILLQELLFQFPEHRMVCRHIVGTVLDAVDAAGIAPFLELFGQVAASPDAAAQKIQVVIGNRLVLRPVHQKHRAGGRFKLGGTFGADDGSGKGHGSLEAETLRKIPGVTVGNVPDGRKGDNGSGRTAGHHYIGRINAQLFLVLGQIGNGRKQILHAHILGFFELTGRIEGPGESLPHLISLHSQAVVYGNNRIPLLVQKVDPVLEITATSGAYKEAPTEHVDDGGFLNAHKRGFRALGRTENIQIQLGGIPLGKRIGFLGGDRAERERQQEDKKQTFHNLAIHAAIDGYNLTGDIGREV